MRDIIFGATSIILVEWVTLLLSPHEGGYSPNEICKVSQEIWPIIRALMSQFSLKGQAKKEMEEIIARKPTNL